MCSFGSKTPDMPQIATQLAQAKAPDSGAVQAAGKRTKYALRAAAATVLTSGSGVTKAAETAQKTLLGS